MKKYKEFDLEERLVDFAVSIIKLTELLPNTYIGNHVKGQILRSGTSPAPNYGEAQSAESRSDFIHKIKLSLKELKETRVWLKIIIKAELIKPVSKVTPILDENEELISILFTSVETARKNLKK
ncbi:four helix bundle protein [bacterium]|nr:four helix bundle protein [bacterium]